VEEIVRNILPFMWAFLISVFAIPSIVDVAHKKRLLDVPNDRTMHELLTPRLGGLAIFAGFISAITIFGKVDYGIQYLLAGCVLIFFIGLKDDIVSVSAAKKFIIQVLAAGVVMFMADLRITSFQGVFGIFLIDPGTSYMLTFIVIIGITNAINLIDGMDGLAGAIVSVCCFSFGIYFFMSEDKYIAPYSFVAFSLLGGIIGFLRYNVNKAKIFMGDTGSLVCGFIVSVLAIKFIESKVISNTSPVAVAILFIPIVDTARVFILRILSGKSPFTPDRNHVHHRLIEIGFSTLSAVAILVIVNIMAIGLVILFDYLPITLQAAILVMYGLLFSVIIEISARMKSAKSKADANSSL
jgi:UDP-GlcNAc:undecaprenyl-phosphate/decaprenyl-phosphate GlcNAc-1-phosphate transferase